MKLNYYLKDPNSKTETYILCSVVIDGVRSRKSTKRAIHPVNWDTKKQRAKTKPDVPHQEINEFLAHVQKDVMQIQNIYLQKGLRLTPARVFEELWKKGDDNTDLITFANQLNTSKKGQVAESTIRYYNDALNSLTRFCEETRATTDFQLIGDDWYVNYNTFLKKRKNSPSTRKQYRQFFRTVFSEAKKKGLHKNSLTKKIKDPIPPRYKIALTDDEIDKLFELKLLDNRLDRIRDLFILGCRTGLRFSDWGSASLPPNGNFLTITTQKTKRPTKIPIHPQARTILEKHNGKINAANYLTDLKRLEALFKYAKTKIPSLARLVEIPSENGVESKERWELVKTHTARRTFASFLYRHREKIGITDVDIMNITAHTSKEAFYKYIVADEDEVQKSVFDFFNRKG